MRRHGWSGTVPATDSEAVERILAATRAVVERSGAACSMAEIARELGVTRQTVYRYFPNADALLAATALAETGRFLDALAEHLGAITDPAEAVVEGIAHALETLPDDRYLGPLLTPGRGSALSAGMTSDAALVLGAASWNAPPSTGRPRASPAPGSTTWSSTCCGWSGRSSSTPAGRRATARRCGNICGPGSRRPSAHSVRAIPSFPRTPGRARYSTIRRRMRRNRPPTRVEPQPRRWHRVA